jgi:hypothetical protein
MPAARFDNDRIECAEMPGRLLPAQFFRHYAANVESSSIGHGTLNSIFSFTDLPMRLPLYLGSIAFVAACIASGVVIGAKLCGDIPVPGYTPIVLASLFFGALTSLGSGIVGQYLWLALQSSHQRPDYIVRGAEEHGRSRTQPTKNDHP